MTSIVTTSVNRPTIPGTINQRLCWLGLNQERTSKRAGASLQAAVRRPLGIEIIDDAAGVTERDQRRVGIATVKEHLHVRLAVAMQIAVERRTDVQHDQGLAAIDQRRDLDCRE